jgi:O-antigen/teichoic acid export membrane protein
MNLYKTTFWSAIATIFRFLTGLITTKIVAIYLGPTGIALYGNFTNVACILTAFSNGAISNGIVKNIAGFSEEFLPRK